MHRDGFDVAIVGAGTAGAALAWQLARRKLTVVVIEKGRLERAGATWFNAVNPAAFDAAGIPRPLPPEDAGNHPTHLIAGWGLARVRVTTAVHDVDMALLGDRLRTEATRNGAVFRERETALDWSAERGLHTTGGAVHARVYVDASGLRGLRPASDSRSGRDLLCAAAQEVRHIRDRRAAREFFDRHGVPEGEVACFTSVAGGYSVVNLRLHGDDVSILTGSIPGRGNPSGLALIRQLLEEQRWIGPARRSGARAIPLAGPPERIDDGPWLRFGDAAGMVWASHGSGIGPQLIASRRIADVLAGGGSAREASDAWAQQCRPGLAEAAAFQRFSLGVNAPLLARWIRSGLMHPELIRAAIEQRPPRIDMRVAGQILRAAASDPGGVRPLMPAVIEMVRARRRAA